MESWSNTDKSDWKRGVWDNEPDKCQWIDDETGLDCLIVRGPSGALCGYVGVPENHSCFEKDYDAVYDELEIDVHGGLTFADRCRPQEDPSKGICHSGEVANKVVWWLGFDCAHLGDIAPKYDRCSDPCDTYKNIKYVTREVTYLASQLAPPLQRS